MSNKTDRGPICFIISFLAFAFFFPQTHQQAAHSRARRLFSFAFRLVAGPKGYLASFPLLFIEQGDGDREICREEEKDWIGWRRERGEGEERRDGLELEEDAGDEKGLEEIGFWASRYF
ncbi:hypothetical protein F5Y03DRAFT_272573 [Xylaria venustula]|nr:hypothetical protein F5Y03DRAFT_272573 [Xylaria venustula]